MVGVSIRAMGSAWGKGSVGCVLLRMREAKSSLRMSDSKTNILAKRNHGEDISFDRDGE